jgi:glycosyltransferase involved in cell wall biosynthesis
MEAMALRRPVISTYIAGIPELVRPGVDGWLVPAGDVGALTHVMQVCLEASVETLERMGDSAHARAQECHNVDNQAAQLSKLFRLATKESPETPIHY